MRRSESSKQFYARVRDFDLPPDTAALGIRYETIRGRGAYSRDWSNGTCYLDGNEVFKIGYYARFRPTAVLLVPDGPHEIAVFGSSFKPNVPPPLIVSKTFETVAGQRVVVHVEPGKLYGFRNAKVHPGHIDLEHLG